MALAGYEFCISTLEEKIEREKELAEDILSGREAWRFWTGAFLHGGGGGLSLFGRRKGRERSELGGGVMCFRNEVA